MIKFFRNSKFIVVGLSLAVGVAACGGEDSSARESGAGGGATTGSGGGTTTGSGGGATTGSGGGATTGSGGGATTGSGGGATAGSGGGSTTASGGEVTTASGGDPNPDPANARTFDHRHASLDDIPDSCVEALKSGDFVFHYAHRSHGFQIIVGAQSIEAKNPDYGFQTEYCDVPQQTDAFLMWDGMIDTNLIPGEEYWATEAGINDVRTILGEHPEIRYSMWAWSSEISEQTEADVQRYLDVLDALGQEFPDVTFIYMTGPGDEEYNGVNRAERNQQIRDFCRDHGKILYDFEDLDVYADGERHTATVDGVEIPMQHPRYDVETSGNAEYEHTHTTQGSCENKAMAFWRMMAELEGCAR